MLPYRSSGAADADAGSGSRARSGLFRCHWQQNMGFFSVRVFPERGG